MPAESHRVRDGGFEVKGLDRFASYVVQLFAILRQVLEVDRRGDDFVLYGKGQHDALGGADGPEGVPRHRLRTRSQGVRHEPRYRLRLWPVSGRGGCGVGVNVADLLGVEAGILERVDHRPLHTAAVHIGRCYVVGVGRAAVAGDGGDRFCAAALRVLLALQDQGPGALAHHETVAAFVEGTTRPGGVVVAATHGPYGTESSHREGRYRGFRGAGYHHVGVIAPDQLQPFRDRLPSRGAGKNRALARSRGAERDSELPGRHVGDHHRDQERAHPSRPPLVHYPVLALPGREPPDTTAHHDRDALGPLANQVDYPRALRGLYARGYAKLGKSVHPASLLLLYKVRRIEIPALTGDPRRIRGGIEERDLPYSALTMQGCIPEVLDPCSKGCHSTGSGYERPLTRVRVGHAA